jgi:hypothetical protein
LHGRARTEEQQQPSLSLAAGGPYSGGEAQSRGRLPLPAGLTLIDRSNKTRKKVNFCNDGKVKPRGAKGKEYTQAHSPRHAWLLRPVFLAWISKKLLLLLKRSSEPQQRPEAAGAGKSKAEAARDE